MREALDAFAAHPYFWSTMFVVGILGCLAMPYLEPPPPTDWDT